MINFLKQYNQASQNGQTGMGVESGKRFRKISIRVVSTIGKSYNREKL